MKRDNMFIYVGTAIFILLAIAIGIVMFMTTRSGVRIENSEKFSQEEKHQANTETVNSEIGKTVEEQQEHVVQENTEQVENTVILDKTDITNIDENKLTEDKPTEIKKEITFTRPTEGEIICEYAKDSLIYSETLKEWITHTAIDIKVDKTSVIRASADGVIKSIVNDPRYGLTVIISHDEGYETIYSNLLTAEFVVEGEEVTQGQTIGTAGNTAAFESCMECHLHFELLKDGEYLDPSIYLK